MAGAVLEHQEEHPGQAEEKAAPSSEDDHGKTKEDVGKGRNGAAGADPERKTGPGRKPRACKKPVASRYGVEGTVD